MSSVNFENILRNFYGQAEAAKVLGVTRGTMYNWMRSGKIKAHKITCGLLFEKDIIDVLKIVQDRKRGALR